jgi:hypothetical protein
VRRKREEGERKEESGREGEKERETNLNKFSWGVPFNLVSSC